MVGSRRRSPEAARQEPATFVAAAFDAFARADFEGCKRLLRLDVQRESADRGRLALLQAKVARIDGDLATWYEAAGVAARDHPDAESRLAALTLRAAAAKRLGKDDESRTLLEDVRRTIDGNPPFDAGYATYLLAVTEWEAGDYDRAQQLIERNLTARSSESESLALLGWIDVKHERFAAAGRRFLAALDALRASGSVDLRLQARLIHAASVVASETINLRAGRRVQREYESMPWPPSLNVERFNTLTCLRFLSLLEGDLPRAWFASRDAAAIAPAPAYTAIGETNAAVASRLLGDRATARLQLARAWEILRGRKWGTADDEARVALTNFAIEGAQEMPAEARKAITLYQSLRGTPNTLNALYDDRRVIAFEMMAAGRVSEGLGRRDLAIEQYRRSLDLWSSLGFTMRAALVALDLRRLTLDDAFLPPVERALARAPNAWFRREFDIEESPVTLLTPTERVVLGELLKGKPAKAIADDLERSQYTVINHTRKIFAAFRVRSRAQLLARYAELKVGGEHGVALDSRNVTSVRLRRSSR